MRIVSRTGLSVLALLIMGGANCVVADPIVITTGFTQIKIGLETGYPNSDYDILNVVGKEVNLNLAPGEVKTIDINTFTFSAAFNAWNIHTDTGTTPERSISLASDPSSVKWFTQNWSIYISPTDTLTLYNGSSSLMDSGIDGYDLKVTPLGKTILGNTSGVLQAQFELIPSISGSETAVPVPSVAILSPVLLAGFVGFGRFRRKRA